jgi:hypothetical protein
MIKGLNCDEIEYKNQIGRIVDQPINVAIVAGLLGSLAFMAGLAVSNIASELLNDGWDCFIECINQDY